jgi:serine/threonine protein kinase
LNNQHNYPYCGKQDSEDEQSAECCSPVAAEIPANDADHDELIGSIAGNGYTILSLAGTGSWSRVYRASQDSLQRVVALKILHANHSLNEAKLRRWEQEAKLGSLLNHQNIVKVLDSGISPRPHIVMEFLEGETLSSYLNRNGAIAFPEAARLLSQICDALHALHTKGIVHRDLKPANIMMVPGTDGECITKLLDFGLAKVLTDGEEVHLTTADKMLGTPAYMSPEQCMGRRLDCRSDIYSLGCLMHEVFTGLKPFDALTAAECIQKQLHEAPTGMTKVRPDLQIPQSLERLVLHALAKEPVERYQSVLGIKNDLAVALADQTANYEYRQISIPAILSKCRRWLRAPKGRFLLVGTVVFVLIGMVLWACRYSLVESIWMQQYQQAKSLIVAKQYDRAQTKLQSLLVITDSFMGSGDWHTARTLVQLRNAYKNSAMAKEATRVDERLNSLVRGSGKWRSELEKASGQVNRGSYETAERVLQNIIDQQQSSPVEELSTASTQWLLSDVCLKDGKLSVAEAAAKASLATRKKFLDQDHPLLIYPLNCLAEIAFQRRELAEAQELYEEALLLARQQLGPGHPDAISILGRLGDVRMAQEDPPGAENYFKQALQVIDSSPSKNAFDAASICAGLATVYYQRHRYDLAEPLFARALAERQRWYGRTHPEVANDLTNLGVLRMHQGRYRRSLDFLNEALQIRIATLGTQHPLTIASRRSYEQVAKMMNSPKK